MISKDSIPGISQPTSEALIRLAVVADTHVPDQAEGLPPGFVEELAKWKVTAVLHAGDICIKAVLEELSQVAPVIAVRGNRDVIFARQLPLVARAEFGGVKLALMHGHGGFLHYLGDKIRYYHSGYQLERYKELLLSVAPEADVIVFGHTHTPERAWHQKRLLFNPGSLIGAQRFKPVYGILEMRADGGVDGKHIFMEGWERKGRHWQKTGGQKD